MSLMKRVSTSHPEGQDQSTSSAPPVAASRLPRGKQADFHAMLENVQRRMLVETDGVLNIKDERLMRQTIEEQLTCVLTEEGIMLNKTQKQEFLTGLIHEILGFGPLEPLLADTSSTDIMIIGPQRVYVERKGKIYKTNVEFRDNAHLMRIIDRILAPLGRRVDESSPMVDARLPDGSRVNAVVPPVALDGAALTIRKFAVTPLTVADLIDFGTATDQTFEFMRAAVIAGMNIIVAGGSSSGKTTLLNVLSGFIPTDERIVTIENAAELQLRQAHVVRLESRPPNMEGAGEISIRDLVINSLRMRPDRIVVGEVRSAEAIDLLQAMNTGHEGSMGTLHANSPQDSLSRLETMVLGAGMNLPVKAIRDQMASAINIIIHMGRDREGVRRVLNISEISGLEGDMISLSEIFRFERTPGADNGQLVATGLIPRCIDRINDAGIHLSGTIFQPPTWQASSSRGKTVQSSDESERPRRESPREARPPAPEPVYHEPEPEPEPVVDYPPIEEFTAEMEQDTWQAEEDYQEPTPPGITDSQTIKAGLLGRLSSNQGTDDHHNVT